MYSQTSTISMRFAHCSWAKGSVWENSLTKGAGRKIFDGITYCNLVTILPLLECVLQCLKMLSDFNMKLEERQLF